MNKTFEFTVAVSAFDADAWSRLQAARETVSKIEKEIVDAFAKSERFKAARDLAGINDYGHKTSPAVHLKGHKIVTTVGIDMVEAATSSRPTLYLAEKTVNMLLSGKLLNEAQKKALLKQIGFDMDNLTA